uniref:Piwi domain-containing protein n=1 Tax=Ditylenchus dipsaci TaxID=166011 RepID=A0A915D7X8_9BILA
MSSYSSNMKSYQKPAASQQNTPSKSEGICTMFLIKVANGKKAFRYDVDIMLVLGNDIPPKKLSKGADDGQRALNRALCSRLLKVAQKKTDCFGLGPQCPIVFDNKCILFTPVQIKSDQLDISISLDEVDEFVKTYCSDRVSFTVNISPTRQGSHVLDLNDIAQYISRASLDQEDHSLRTFLELATSQYALDNDLYTAIGAAKLYQNNQEKKIGHGIVLRPGITRGTRVVQNFDKPMPALVLDAQVSPFYAAQPLITTVMEMNGNRAPRNEEEWTRTFNLLKDVRVCVTYNRKRSFGIGKFTQEEVGQIPAFKEENSGRMVSIPEYYNEIKFEQYKVRVSNLNLRGVIPNTPQRDPSKPEIFPIECLEVMRHQKVPMEKTRFHNSLSTDLIKVNVVLPNERNKQILEHAARLGIFDTKNAVLAAFGITIELKTFNVPIEKQQCSNLKYGDAKFVMPNGENATWNARANKYISPAKISSWIVVYNTQHKDVVLLFVNKFVEDCKSRGIQFLNNPQPVKFDGPIDFEDTFKKCVERKVEFVLLIDPLTSDTHGALKYYEALYKVASQHITVGTAEKIVKQNQGRTMENIINKTNCKLNGLNYVPLINDVSNAYSLEKGDILVIGYDVAHPTSGSPFDPSVVGICANMAPNKHNFVGDYFYQASCKESVDSDQLTERIIWILMTLKKNRPTNRPKTVVILRDGLSEGQFKMAVEEELSSIRKAFATCGIKEGQIQFVFVIATKRHNKRFFLGQLGQTLENVAPGSIIQEKFVREDVLEWFQLPHKAIKGTAQAVQYGIPVNEPKISKKDLQAFLTTLCFNHQIVNCAVSLPEPVYQADELAKRGFNNYVTMKKINQRRFQWMQPPTKWTRRLCRRSYLSRTQN